MEHRNNHSFVSSFLIFCFSMSDCNTLIGNYVDDTNCSISSADDYGYYYDVGSSFCKERMPCHQQHVFRLYSGIDCESLHFLTEQRERGNVVVLDPRANVHSCVFSEEEESKILSFFKLYSLCDHQTLFEKWLCLNGSDVY